MAGHLGAHLSRGIHLVGIAHRHQQQAAQIIYNLASKLTRVAARIQRAMQHFQALGRLVGNDRFQQIQNSLAGGRTQHRLGHFQRHQLAG